MNFLNFLNGSMRILNIANKTLPVLKMSYPYYLGLKKRINKYRGVQNIKPNNFFNLFNNYQTPKQINNSKAINNPNISFFQ